MAVPGATPPPVRLQEPRGLDDLTLVAQLCRGRATTTFAAWDRSGTWRAVRILNTAAYEDEFSIRAARPHGLCIGHPAQTVSRQGPTTYATAPLVTGESLATLLDFAIEQGRPFPLSVALTIALGIARQLGRLGEREIHGDLVPHHVLVSYDGHVELIDAVGRQHALEAGRVPGRSAYRSPEHVKGSGLGLHSDVYLLGIHLFEMSTGVRLFADNDPDRVDAQIVQSRLPRPRELVGDRYPIELQLVLRKLLRPTPAGRFVDAPSARDALRLVATTRTDMGAEALGAWLKQEHANRWAAWQAFLQNGPGEAASDARKPSRANTEVVLSSPPVPHPLSGPPTDPQAVVNLEEDPTQADAHVHNSDAPRSGSRLDTLPLIRIRGDATEQDLPRLSSWAEEAPSWPDSIPGVPTAPDLPTEVPSLGELPNLMGIEPADSIRATNLDKVVEMRRSRGRPASILDLDVAPLSEKDAPMPGAEDTELIRRGSQGPLTEDLLGELGTPERDEVDFGESEPLFPGEDATTTPPADVVLGRPAKQAPIPDRSNHSASAAETPHAKASLPWDPDSLLPPPPTATPPSQARVPTRIVRERIGPTTPIEVRPDAPHPADEERISPAAPPIEVRPEAHSADEPVSSPESTSGEWVKPRRPATPISAPMKAAILPPLEDSSAEDLVVPVSDAELERVARRRSFMGWLMATAGLAAIGMAGYLVWALVLGPNADVQPAPLKKASPAALPTGRADTTRFDDPRTPAKRPSPLEKPVLNPEATGLPPTEHLPPSNVLKPIPAKPSRVLVQVVPDRASISTEDGTPVENGSYVNVATGPVTLRVTLEGYEPGVFILERGRRRPLVVVLDRIQRP